ncbi:MAG: hypothetical protein WDM88_07985 [Galbitalea sp.]
MAIRRAAPLVHLPRHGDRLRDRLRAALPRWQFGRNEQTIAENTLVTTNYRAAAVTPATLLPTKSSYSAKNEWRSGQARR